MACLAFFFALATANFNPFGRINTSKVTFHTRTAGLYLGWHFTPELLGCTLDGIGYEKTRHICQTGIWRNAYFSTNCCHRLRRVNVSYEGEISLHLDLPSQYGCRTRSPLLWAIIRILYLDTARFIKLLLRYVKAWVRRGHSVITCAPYILTRLVT